MATVNLTTTPTQIDSGTGGSLFIVNTGAVEVELSRAQAGTKPIISRIRPAQNATIIPEGSAVTAATVSGTGSISLTTTPGSSAAPSLAALESVANIRTYMTAGTNAATSAQLVTALAAIPAGQALDIPAAVTVTLTSTVTVDSRTLTGGGTITGSAVSGGVLLNLAGSRPSLRGGLKLYHEGGTVVVNVTANTTDWVIDGCIIGSVGNAPSQAVAVNATGIARGAIRNNRFDIISYGVLTNAAATDLADLKITGNTFTNVYADAIELNHPGTAYVAGKNIIITGNTITASMGNYAGSGFGVGIAGATGVVIANNIFEACRVQAIHFEDECAHIIIKGNIFRGSTPISIWGLDGDHITIEGNHFYQPTQYGIQMTYDASNQPTRVKISGNTIIGAGSIGAYLLTQYGGQLEFTHNTVADCLSDGLWIGGDANATLTGRHIVADNIFAGNAVYGYEVQGYTGMNVHDNFTAGNTTGPFRRNPVASGILQQICNPVAEGDDATVASGSSGWVPVFPLGTAASGVLYAAIQRVTSGPVRSQSLWNIAWDGSVFSATYLNGANATASAVSVRRNASTGNLEISATGLTDGQTVRVNAQLNGMILL